MGFENPEKVFRLGDLMDPEKYEQNNEKKPAEKEPYLSENDLKKFILRNINDLPLPKLREIYRLINGSPDAGR